MTGDVQLRDMTESDLAIFFEFQLDPEARHMAAFTARDPTDREAYMAHQTRNLADPSKINKTVLLDGQVAGSIFSWEQLGEREVGYWIGKQYWGRGVATTALMGLLREVSARPLYAHAATDNVASLRVLQKCGFRIIGEGRGFAHARGQEIEEYTLMLAADVSDPAH
jgi:RimJ/RimL family protein N-acetyltransferase